MLLAVCSLTLTLSNITSMLSRCTDISLIDQRSQRIALAATVYSAHGAASHLPNPCAQGQGQVQHCVSMHLCLDYALLQLSSQQPVKNLRITKARSLRRRACLWRLRQRPRSANEAVGLPSGMPTEALPSVRNVMTDACGCRFSACGSAGLFSALGHVQPLRLGQLHRFLLCPYVGKPLPSVLERTRIPLSSS